MVQGIHPVNADTPQKNIIRTMSNPDELIFYKGIVPLKLLKAKQANFWE